MTERVCPSCAAKAAGEARFCPSCGGPLPAPADPAGEDPLLGRTLAGKYYVQQVLGAGGMGTVYKAQHLALDKPIALKLLRKSLLDDPSIVARFQREARASSRLNHPGCIQVSDFGQIEDGSLFIVMEYLAGRDLQRILAAEFPLDERRICHWIAQALAALAEAHANGVIHRDLKPENIMVEPRRDEPEFVKVLDFGIAKIQDRPGSEGGPALTRQGIVCGTPEYMSPEQARGLPLDARSDLYSIGVILYQLATGHLPFDADSSIGFVTAHLTESPVPPRARRDAPPISEALERLILRCLEKDPARRPGSADELRAELLAIARDAPPSAPRSSSAPAVPIVASTQLFSTPPSVPPTPTPVTVPGRPAVQGEGAAGSPPSAPAASPSSEVAGPSRTSGSPSRAPATGDSASDHGGPARGLAAPALGTPAAAVASPPSAAPGAADAAPPRRLRRAIAAAIVVVAAGLGWVVARPSAVSGGSAPTDVAPSRPAAAKPVPAAAAPAAPRFAPGTAGALVETGLARLAEGNAAEAESYARNALRVDPNWPAAHRLLGLALAARGESQKAVRALRQYLKLEPTAADAAEIRRRIATLGG